MARAMSFLLHNSYTFWISRLASVMQDRFNKELETLGVTWPQWMVMNVLSHGSANTPAHIAEQIGVDRSAVTRLVDRLEKKGLVVREHDGLDRRSVKIHITSPGKLMVKHLDEAAERHQSVFLNELQNTEHRALKGNIQKLLHAGGIETALLWRHQ